MLDVESLSAYLNDHRAGATAAVHLLDRLVEDDDLVVDRASLDRVRDEVREDLETLESLMARLDVARDRVRASAGWLGEKLAQVRLNEAVTGSPALSQLLELETIAVGVQGKLCLWEALRSIVGGEARLVADELDLLAARAREQADVLEKLRQTAAARALRPATA